ncbi:MAG TPA: multidrug transporter, partial [Lachnospiraceae bacterium]|nr:multidrug transporter [Lachnospiraceae bacterium]
MVKYEEVKTKSTDGLFLSLAVYETADAAACVQLIHGMAEHKGRYDDFARFLAGNGYNVVSSDLRGHGKDAPL